MKQVISISLAVILLFCLFSYNRPETTHAAYVLGTPVCDNWKPINTTANVQLITASAGQFVYICSINIVVGAADNVALVEGTGATCGTGTAGMMGGATAATGWNFGANGGIAHGSGFGAVAKTATAGDNVCLLVSAAAQASGSVSWTALSF